MTAVLNLLSLYHDTLLARRLSSPDTNTKVKPLIPPTEHSRYTRAWTDRRSAYKHAARGLEVIRFVQLVVEMSLRRRLGAGSMGVWRLIVALEALKCVHHVPYPFPLGLTGRLTLERRSD